jgi:cystathionine beta-lyase/cystathionine gamma-synthase
VLRGLKTLHLRMQRHCENGKAVAEWLVKHPKVDKVYWPGFPRTPTMPWRQARCAISAA